MRPRHPSIAEWLETSTRTDGGNLSASSWRSGEAVLPIFVGRGAPLPAYGVDARNGRLRRRLFAANRDAHAADLRRAFAAARSALPPVCPSPDTASRPFSSSADASSSGCRMRAVATRAGGQDQLGCSRSFPCGNGSHRWYRAVLSASASAHSPQMINARRSKRSASGAPGFGSFSKYRSISFSAASASERSGRIIFFRHDTVSGLMRS
jgi:hypothetical protein